MVASESRDDGPTALVLVLGGLADGAGAEHAADALGAAAPQAAIVALELELDLERLGALSRLEAALADACARSGLTPSETILIGRGAAGALALEASLVGAHALCGAIVLDPPLETAWTDARWRPRIRVLQHADASSGDCSLMAFVEVLRELEVEVRCVQLPPHGLADGAGVLRTVGVFLAELAAYAGEAGRRRRAT
jgi:hypothetical protein